MSTLSKNSARAERASSADRGALRQRVRPRDGWQRRARLAMACRCQRFALARIRLWAIGLLASLPLFGCGSGIGIVRPLAPSDVRAVAAFRGVDNVIVPFAINQEMRSWVHDAVPGSVMREQRLDHLANRLLDKGGVGLDYTDNHTGTAREVFETGQANCLAFTMLYVGMARELGLPVYFLLVRDITDYERDGDLVVVSDHIAVGHGPIHELTVIDFSERKDRQYHQIRPINDISATALYYSNKGAEQLRLGQPDGALEWLERSVLIEPELAAGWINLGVARRRSGNLEGAERAYRTAIEVEPQALSAYHNLATLLRIRGEEDQARDLLAVMDRGTNRNPFSYVALGDVSKRHGELEEAERFYRRALRLDKTSAESHAALGLLLLDGGDAEGARRSLRRALRFDPTDERTRRLQDRLATIQDG